MGGGSNSLSLVKRIQLWWHQSDSIILCTVLFTLVSFLPMAQDFGLMMENSPLQQALDTSNMMFVYGVTIAACFSMIVDLLLDFISKTSHARFFVQDRLLILIAVSIVPALYFIMRPHTRHHATLFMCFFTAQRVAIGAPLCRSLRLSPSRIFTKRFGNTTFVLFALAQIMIQYWGLCHSDTNYRVLFPTSWVVIGAAFGYFLWHFKPYISFILNSTTVVEDEYIPCTFSCLLLLLEVGLTLINTVGAQQYADYSVGLVGSLNAVLVLTTVVATVLPGRIARSELADRERMIELKQNFVRYISHEIRTPINISLVGLEVLEKNLLVARMEDDSMDVVKQIKDAITSATDVLNDLLTYEKITSNLMTLERSQEVPLEIIVPTVTLFRIGALSKNINLTIEIADEMDYWLVTHARLDIDKFKIVQIIRNFMSNALKFTPRGGDVTVKVSTFKNVEDDLSRMMGDDRSISHLSYKWGLSSYAGLSSNNNRKVMSMEEGGEGGGLWMRICIVDTGAGIAQSNLYKVFNQIIQFDANKLQAGKGSGLGLYISKGICDLHNGHVYVRSKGLGKGCAFYLELPLIEHNSNNSIPDISTAHLQQQMQNGHVPSIHSNSIPRSRSRSQSPGHVLVSPRHQSHIPVSLRPKSTEVMTSGDVHAHSQGSTDANTIKNTNTRINDLNSSNNSHNNSSNSMNANNNNNTSGNNNNGNNNNSSNVDNIFLPFFVLTVNGSGKDTVHINGADATHLHTHTLTRTLSNSNVANMSDPTHLTANLSSKSYINPQSLTHAQSQRALMSHSSSVSGMNMECDSACESENQDHFRATLPMKSSPQFMMTAANRATSWGTTNTERTDHTSESVGDLNLLNKSSGRTDSCSAIDSAFGTLNTFAVANMARNTQPQQVAHGYAPGIASASADETIDDVSSLNTTLFKRTNTAQTGQVPHSHASYMHGANDDRLNSNSHHSSHNNSLKDENNNSSHGIAMIPLPKDNSHIHANSGTVVAANGQKLIRLSSSHGSPPSINNTNNPPAGSNLMLATPYMAQPFSRTPSQNSNASSNVSRQPSNTSGLISRNTSAAYGIAGAGGSGDLNPSSYPLQVEAQRQLSSYSDAPAGAAAADMHHLSSDEAILTGKTLLVVDDSAINLKMVVLFFKKLGANVYQAHDGKEAVEIIKQSLVGTSPAGGSLVHATGIGKLLPAVSATFSASFARHNSLGMTGHQPSGHLVHQSSQLSPHPHTLTHMLSSHLHAPHIGFLGGGLHHAAHNTHTHTSSLSPSPTPGVQTEGNNSVSINHNQSQQPHSPTTTHPAAVLPHIQEPIDLVVMDNLMPIMNGPDAAKAMRELGFTGPIFGLTGHALRDDINHYIKCGADTVFKKPIDVKRFCRIFRNYMNGINITHEVDSMYLD